MDTRLKSFMKDKKEWMWCLGVVLCTETAILSRIFFHYRRYENFWSVRGIIFYKFASVALLLAALLMGIALFRQLFHIEWKHMPEESDRLQKIPVELLAVTAIAGGWVLYITLMPENYWFTYAGWYYVPVVIWGRFVLNTFWNMLLFVILLTLVLIAFYGSLYLLYRRFRKKTWKKTSMMHMAFVRYQTATSLERKLRHRQRAAWAAMVVLILGIFLIAFDEMQYVSPGRCALVGALLLILLIVYWKSNISGKLLRDIGCLTEQIHALFTGEAPEEAMRLPEKSLLYPAQEELEHIDATIQQSVEKQMQAKRLKVDLITNMSHDLKTPLTSMVGYTDLLKKEGLSREARDYVEVISMKQEQLKNMIQDLFDLSKATSGTQQFTLETLDMRRLLEQTTGDMEDSIANSGLTVRSRFSEEPLLFVGDNEKMYRVVQNLLENALKYSLPNTRIYLEADREQGKIWMEMKNIASYEMNFVPEEIMERFVRGDQSRTTEGHGLGLAIASSFVQNMKGTLEVKVDGDMFKVRLEFPEAVKSAEGR